MTDVLTMITRPGSRIARDVLLVVMPGLLVVVETVLLLLPDAYLQSASQWDGVFDALTKAGWVLQSLGFLLVLFASYFMGRICRSMVFRSPRWLPPIRRLSLREVLASLERAFGEDPVHKVLSPQPFWPMLRDSKLVTTDQVGSVTLPTGRQEGERHDTEVDSRRGWVFWYCKAWLREKAPTLGVDHIETEINALYNSIIPVVLSIPVAFRLSGIASIGQPADSISASVWSVLAIYVALQALLDARNAQRIEHVEAIRHFVLAKWLMAESARAGLAEGGSPREHPPTDQASENG